jgi:hypothetical protein
MRFLHPSIGFILFAVPALGGVLDWKPVDPADLALKAARVEKDADAEAIFWEVWVMDEADGGVPRTVLTNYVRIKIFTDRGREKHSTIDLPFAGRNRIKDIAGRTVKSDGTILELKKDAVYERMIVKAGNIKVKAKSFAMPGVEPGAIVEYRWREYRDGQLANYLRLPFQRDVPIQLVQYHIKPLNVPYLPFGMRSMNFHSNNTPFAKDRDGFYTTMMTDVPAFVEEPQMPPLDDVRAWMLIYYSEDKKVTPEQYWKDYGRKEFNAFKESTKVNGGVRKAAESIVSGAANDEEKLRKLFDYCRTKIKNVQRDTVTAEERADTKKNKTPADTINQGAGTGFDIDMAFAALASAAGFDARIARLGNRADKFFDPTIADSVFISGFDVAVNTGGKWLFYDPGSTYVPFGMLGWWEEGQKALVSDGKEPEFVNTPLAGPEKSVSKRNGVFRLSEDGTLEGDVRLTYSGHQSISRKNDIESDSEEQRKENVREMVKNQMSTAELSDVQVDNATDPEKPLEYRYHVKVTGYAQRTGKRLFLQPAFFEFNLPATFTSATRKYPIYFHYPWSEEDYVEVKLPPGYELDHADAPSPVEFAPTGGYNVKIQISSDKRLLYSRKLAFGNNGRLLFPVATYQALKQVFDAIHQADMHAITLKQAAAVTQ